MGEWLIRFYKCEIRSHVDEQSSHHNGKYTDQESGDKSLATRPHTVGGQRESREHRDTEYEQDSINPTWKIDFQMPEIGPEAFEEHFIYG